MKAWSSLLFASLGATAGLAFFLAACVAYAATPSDPQKPVGYVFIAFYSLMLGGAVFGFASSLSSLFEQPRSSRSFVLRLSLAIVCAAIVTGIVIQHRHSLF